MEPFQCILVVQKPKLDHLRFLSSLIGISLCVFTYAQKPFYYIQDHERVQIDTLTLDGVEDFGMNSFVVNLGNHGSPQFNLKPEIEDLISNDYSSLSFLKGHQFVRYHVYKPIVDAKYVIGRAQEQHFSLVHSQNVSKNVNYSIGLDKINSKGLYQNQATNNTDIYLNSYGTGLFKNRYDFDLTFNYINAASALNGGLEDDSTFINDTLDLQNRALLDVNLQNAYQELRRWNGVFGHSYKILNQLDSAQKGYTIALLNRFEFQQNSRLFYDSILNTSFYDRILDDSLLTNETIKYQSTEGYLGLKFGSYGNSDLILDGGIQSSYNTYTQSNLDTFRWDMEGKLNGLFIWQDFIIQTKLAYLINDAYSSHDYNVDLEVWKSIGKFDLFGKAYLSNERPQIDLLKYSGNNVSWNNSFQKYQIRHYELGVNYSGKWNSALKVNYFDVIDPIYFGYDKTPYQIDGISQLIRSSVELENAQSEKWDLKGEFHYQYLGGYNVFRLPSVLSAVSAAFKFKAFKHKMNLAIGTKITYFNKYSSKSFDPVSGQYFIAADDKVGNYPYADIYLKGRVQRATFFIMMSNPQQGLLGYNYFYFPGYPANDRFYRIGVSWLFLN